MPIETLDYARPRPRRWRWIIAASVVALGATLAFVYPALADWKGRFDDCRALRQAVADGTAAAQGDWDAGRPAVCRHAPGLRAASADNLTVQIDADTGLPIRLYGGGCMRVFGEDEYVNAYNARVAELVARHGTPANARPEWFAVASSLPALIAAADWRSADAADLPPALSGDHLKAAARADVAEWPELSVFRADRDHPDVGRYGQAALVETATGLVLASTWTFN